MLIALGLLTALALAGACGGGSELPEGFPRDFPLYDKATVEVATNAPEGGGFLVSMDTEDSRDQVRAFYERALDEDPWQVQNVNVVEVPEEGDEVVVIEFARVGDGGESGTVAISVRQEDKQHTTIAISLTTPP
jgi:hypothetical protein